MALSAPASVHDAAQSRHKNITKLIVATSVGNALEWFDISSYAYFAIYISKAFFPANDPTTSLLLTFGTFGLSFLIRGNMCCGVLPRRASLIASWDTSLKSNSRRHRVGRAVGSRHSICSRGASFN